MQNQPLKIPIYLDIDKNPISEQLGFPFLQDPTDIRWAVNNHRLYRVTGMPNIYCDAALILLDRAQEEVLGWLHDRHGLDNVSAEYMQECIKNWPENDLSPLPSPLAFSEVNGAASWMHFDIGIEKPLSINAEAFSWLSKQGYSLHYQPGKRKSGVILKRRSEALAGLLMPGDVDLTIRQIYMKALKSHAIEDRMSELAFDHGRNTGRQLIEDESDDPEEVRVKTFGFVTGRQAVKEGFEIIERLYEGDRDSEHKVCTGYSGIDRMLGGIDIGDVTVIAGDSVSSFLANIVRKNASRLRKPIATAVICMKKDIPDIGIKLLCMEAHLYSNEIKKGLIREQDWGRLASAAGNMTGHPLYMCTTFPSSIDDAAERVRALKAEKRDLRIVIIDTLEMITGDDKVNISSGLRSLKQLADELSIAVIIGSNSNMIFKHNKRNMFERYADTILMLRKNERDYTTEIISHDENDRRFDYDDKLRGIVKISKRTTILAKYPFEVQVRNMEGLLGSAFLQYIPQKGVFVNGK